MHYLTGIIVSSKEDLTNEEARSMAEQVLLEFENSVWDWYENSPGRWSGEYGTGVFKATSPRFHETVKTLMDSQRKEYELLCKNVKDIEEYIKRYESGESTHDLGCWNLLWLAQFIYGEFTSNSHIYDSCSYTSYITNDMMEYYRINPDMFYLVLFDVHN